MQHFRIAAYLTAPKTCLESRVTQTGRSGADKIIRGLEADGFVFNTGMGFSWLMGKTLAWPQHTPEDKWLLIVNFTWQQDPTLLPWDKTG